MASVPLLIPVGSQFLDNTGKPLSGGFLYTYQAGSTNTPLQTFSDEGLTTPNPNPIPLNSAGRCASSFSGSEINVYPSQNSYKLVLTDSASNPIWTHDFVDPSAPFNVLTGATFVNPTITNPTVTGGTFSSPTITTPGVTGGTFTNPTLTNPTSSSGTLTNATLVTPTITTPTITGGTQSAPTIASPEIDTSVVSIGGLLITNLCQGRLTLTSGTPVTTANVTAAATVYFTPYLGNSISLFDGISKWTLLTFAETSVALGTLTSGLPYDIFAFNNSGTLGLRAPVAWASTTSRVTGLVLQNGIYVKSGATTDRYLGTFHTTSTTTTEDSGQNRYLWNYYNRLRRNLVRLETTATWNYSIATVRQANGSTANQVNFVAGLQESLLDVALNVSVSNSTGGTAVVAGIALDSTTVFTVSSYAQPAAGVITPLSTRLAIFQSLGQHSLMWNEYSGAVLTTTWYGGEGGFGSTAGAGLDGWIEA